MTSDALRGVAAAAGPPAAEGETGTMPSTRTATSTRTEWFVEAVAWDDPRAQALRGEMDAEIGPRYADRLEDVPADVAARLGSALAVNAESIVSTIIVRDAARSPVGHAALRDLGGDFADSLEVKRVYVAPAARGTGVSRLLMAELERIAAEHGAQRLILQTGDRQPEAVTLYERIGYTRIPIYPPYLEISFSQCFHKPLVG
jgi:GNAT superfamily N-acetyltransferase